MFSFRASVKATSTTSRVEVAFTDSSLDLQGVGQDFPAHLAQLEAEIGVPLARLTQVHADDVCVVEAPMRPGEVPTGDALVTTSPGLGLMVRVADCVPVVIADSDARVVGVAHAGRKGMALDIVTRTIERMRGLGAERLAAWIGPHVCGACYEVPEGMRAEVAASAPESFAQTSWGTPSLDLGAGVRAQLERAGATVTDVGRCTVEDQGLYSHRRDAAAAGRFAGLVWISTADVMDSADSVGQAS